MSKQTDLINVTDAITVSGSNVGIGTSSVNGALHVQANPTAEFSLWGGGGSYGRSKFNIQSVDDGTSLGKFQITTESTVPSSPELMTITNSGNVGIGTSSPSTPSGSCLSLYNATLPRLNFKNSTTGDGTFDGFELYMQGTLAGVNNKENGAIAFGTNDSERMRIDSSGYFLVNRNASSGTIRHELNFSPTSEIAVRYHMTDTTYNNALMEFRRNDGVRVGYIYANGSATSYSTSSDYRLKTDAQPMTGASARVQALNPVNFEWLSDGTRVDGFLAHEAQDVVPEAVTGTKDAMMDEEYEVTPAVLDDDGNVVTEAVMGTRSVPDYQGIDQSKLVPLLTAALQEALTEISDLKARVTALEAV